MEKRIMGMVLSVLGVIGLIYAGIIFLNKGVDGKDFKTILVAGTLGALFFFAGISLIRTTKDKPT
jgi:hypothetical protein